MQHLRRELARADKENTAVHARVEKLDIARDEQQRAAAEAIGILHRLGQGRDLLPEEILTVRKQTGGEALPDLIELLLRYRNHPFEEGTRRALGKAKRTVLGQLRRGGSTT